MRRGSLTLRPITLIEHLYDHISGTWRALPQREFWLTNEESRELHARGDTIEAAESILYERDLIAKGCANSGAARVHQHPLHDKLQWACIVAANQQSRAFEALATPTQKAYEGMKQVGVSVQLLAADKIDWGRTAQCGEHVADTWEGFATETTTPKEVGGYLFVGEKGFELAREIATAITDERLREVAPKIGMPTDETNPVLDAQEIADILAKGIGGTRKTREPLGTSKVSEALSKLTRLGSKAERIDPVDEVRGIMEPFEIRGTKYFHVTYGAKVKPVVYTLDFPDLCIRVECENPEAFVAAGLLRINDGPVSRAYSTVIGNGGPIR